MSARSLGVLALLLCAACNDNDANPFAGVLTRPPSASAAVFFVSGSWSSEPAQPRELFALDADGANAQRLTSCAEVEEPCDFLRVAPGNQRSRVIAIRSAPEAAPDASALYFMDLSRSVEQLVFPGRRVSAADWAPDGSLLVYSSSGEQLTENDDLFASEPNGANDQNLTQSPTVRERNPICLRGSDD